MSKRISVRGIIIDGNEVYTIYRRKVNNIGSVKEYYVIPGGGLEKKRNFRRNIKARIKGRTINRC